MSMFVLITPGQSHIEDLMDGWMDGWINGWMDKWMHGWMNGLIVSLRHRPARKKVKLKR